MYVFVALNVSPTYHCTKFYSILYCVRAEDLVFLK